MGYSTLQHKTLANGLQIACITTKSTQLIHCGFFIKAGSSNDGKLPGLAHCLEHMLFKGTSTRTNIEILNYLENVGGEMNAFTGKEYTSYYATVQKKYAYKAVDILTDIVFNSTFPKKELQREKKVIAEEISMYKDTPDEFIFDTYHELYYKHPSFAHNILGNKSSLRAIQSADLMKFTQQFYQPSNMIFACVGNIELAEIEKYLTDFTPKKLEKKLTHKKANQQKTTAFTITKKTTFNQAHILLGMPAVKDDDADKMAALLINNHLGGPAMNSVINMEIREKNGYAYHAESVMQTFTESGIFYTYIGCDKKNVDACLRIVHEIFERINNAAYWKKQLPIIKEQFIGQMLIAEENNQNVLMVLGKNMLLHNRFQTLADAIKDVEKISAENVVKTCKKIINKKNISQLIFLPK